MYNETNKVELNRSKIHDSLKHRLGNVVRFVPVMVAIFILLVIDLVVMSSEPDWSESRRLIFVIVFSSIVFVAFVGITLKSIIPLWRAVSGFVIVKDTLVKIRKRNMKRPIRSHIRMWFYRPTMFIFEKMGKFVPNEGEASAYSTSVKLDSDGRVLNGSIHDEYFLVVFGKHIFEAYNTKEFIYNGDFFDATKHEG